jgi:methylthioribose-1-phosphate isomerase
MNGSIPAPVEWRGDSVAVLDQRALPHRIEYLECRTVEEVARAIRTLAVRGAPVLGITAAYGIALAAAASTARGTNALFRELNRAGDTLKATRPTAVNIRWAADRMLEVARGECCSVRGTSQRVHEAMVAEALRIEAEDRDACAAMGRAGAELVPDPANVLTHCNTGSLCTAGIGTAQGVIVAAHRSGKRVHVWVDETRPVWQGARLTAWELQRLGVPMTLVADGAAGSLMAAGKVDLVVVGADRIAANGDVANKLGTYPLAVLARYHGVPFYVAAPVSTIDPGTATGAGIVIEERDPAEVVAPMGLQVAAPGTPAANPAFDVTPAEMVTAIVTERGVVRPPYQESLSGIGGGRGGA